MIVDDKGSTFLNSPPVAHLSFSGAKSLGLVHLLNVSPALDIPLEEDHGFLGLGEALNLVSHNKRNLRDVINTMP